MTPPPPHKEKRLQQYMSEKHTLSKLVLDTGA